MSDKKLRNKIIKLAYEKEDLREDLLPLLKVSTSKTARQYRVLSTRNKMNPSNPEESEYYNEQQIAYIFDTSRGPVVITSFGALPGFDVGEVKELEKLGWSTIIGTHDFSSNKTEGEVPNKPLNHWVFK